MPDLFEDYLDHWFSKEGARERERSDRVLQQAFNNLREARMTKGNTPTIPQWAREQIVKLVNKQVSIPRDNFTKGRGPMQVDTIIIHLMDGSSAGTESWFKNPASDVSAHFGISKTGELTQYVNLDDTAWHAGGNSFKNNQRSVGIEHEGRSADQDLWTPAMMTTSAKLSALLVMMYGLPVAALKPHSNFNPAHNCPGPKFNWEGYRQQVNGFLDLYTKQRIEETKPVVDIDKAHSGEQDVYIEMPLYTGSGRKVGGIRFKKGTGKAFIDESKSVTHEEMRLVLKNLGYGSILNND